MIEKQLLSLCERRFGITNLKDVCSAFQYKKWWIFRTKKKPLGDFLRATYFQTSNKVLKKWDTGESLTWKYMLQNRHQFEKRIQWKHK